MYISRNASNKIIIDVSLSSDEYIIVLLRSIIQRAEIIISEIVRK